MNKLLLKQFLFIYFLLCTAPAYGLANSQSSKSTILFSTGTMNGIYYQVGKHIVSALNNDSLNVEFVVIPSNGSVDNMEKLEKGIADWAIVQRDVAVDFRFRTQNPFIDFELILPLFKESVQIFINPSTDIFNGNWVIDFTSFRKLIQAGKIKNLVIGPAGSGSNKVIKDILNLYGIPLLNINILELPFEQGIALYRSGEVQAIAGVWGIPNPYLSDLYPSIMVSFDASKDIPVLSNHLPNLEKVVIMHPFSGKDLIITVSTWAFLVARKEANQFLPPDCNIVQLIFQHIVPNKHILPAHSIVSEKYPFQVKKYHNKYLLIPNKPNAQQMFRGIELHKDLRKAIKSKMLRPFYIFLILIIILLISAGGLFKVHLLKNNFRLSSFLLILDIVFDFWNKHKRTIIALFLALFLIIPITFLLKYFEIQFYREHLIKSPFIDYPFFSLVRWLFIFALTGFEQGIFPKSTGGQIIATITSFIGWAVIVLAVFIEIIEFQRKRRRRMGMEKIKLKNHIVICGCNDHLPQMLVQAISSEKHFINKKHRKRFVVLDSRFKKYTESHGEIAKLIDDRWIYFIDGDPKNESDLQKANLESANAVILIADDRTKDADEKTLLRALSISRYCRQQLNHYDEDSIYMIAEINNPEFEVYLKNADVNEIICTSSLLEKIVLQTSLNHGLSEVLNEVLSYNEFNEFYTVFVDEYPGFIGKTYDEILFELRKRDILLIGIRIVFWNNNHEIIDKTIIETKLKARSLKRHIIVNPLEPAEKEYKIEPHDQLIVLSKNEKILKKQLKDFREKNKIKDKTGVFS